MSGIGGCLYLGLHTNDDLWTPQRRRSTSRPGRRSQLPRSCAGTWTHGPGMILDDFIGHFLWHFVTYGDMLFRQIRWESWIAWSPHPASDPKTAAVLPLLAQPWSHGDQKTPLGIFPAEEAGHIFFDFGGWKSINIASLQPHVLGWIDFPPVGGKPLLVLWAAELIPRFPYPHVLSNHHLHCCQGKVCSAFAVEEEVVGTAFTVFAWWHHGYTLVI